jgi:hypothetical protein
VKGIVFNLLERVVSDKYGDEVWDALLEETGLAGAYTSLGSYDDAEIEALVDAACARLGVSRGEALRWFGQEAMPLLAKAYPSFFTPHASARPFVAGVNSIIHAEVRKLYSGADCPHFNMRESADGALVMDYRSSRRMCALAQGFVEGAATHYDEIVDFRHAQCAEHGDAHCVFEIRWPKIAA